MSVWGCFGWMFGGVLETCLLYFETFLGGNNKGKLEDKKQIKHKSHGYMKICSIGLCKFYCTPYSMNSLFGEFFKIFGQIFGQILTRFWARFWARFLARFWARFWGARKYSVQFFWDRENTVYSSTGTEKCSITVLCSIYC